MFKKLLSMAMVLIIAVSTTSLSAFAEPATYFSAVYKFAGYNYPICRMKTTGDGDAYNLSGSRVGSSNYANVFISGANLIVNNVANPEFNIRMVNVATSAMYYPTPGGVLSAAMATDGGLSYSVYVATPLASGVGGAALGTYDFYYTTNATSFAPNWTLMTTDSAPSQPTTTASYISSVIPSTGSMPYYGGNIIVNISGYNLNQSNNLLVRGMATYNNNNSPGYNKEIITVYTNNASISNVMSNGSYTTAVLSFLQNPTSSNIKYDLQYSNDGGKTWIDASTSVVLSYNPSIVDYPFATTATQNPLYNLSGTIRNLAKPSNVRALIANNAITPITFANIQNKESRELSCQFNLLNMSTMERDTLKNMSESQLSNEMTKISDSIASIHFNGVTPSDKAVIEEAIRGQKAKVITMYFGLKAYFTAPVQLYVPYSRSDFSTGSYFLYKYAANTGKSLEYVGRADVNAQGVMICSISDTQSTYFVCNQRLSSL